MRRLLDSKKGQDATISVVIPARNEERTVGGVVKTLAQALMAESGLIDELVVMDSDSTDATFEVATEAGATVYRTTEVAPELGRHPGKGEALWKSLLVAKGDLLVFVDADLTHWGPHFVTGLLGPLLADERVLLVKGFYERLYTERDGSASADGGRVTELVARPLLSLWWPEFAGVVQPLAGEWAARRSLLASLPIPVGYGVELATLLDTASRHGLDAVAQVDLGRRGHRHQASHDLAVMAAELLVVAERRRAAPAGLTTPVQLHQFARTDNGLQRRSRPVPTHERPPVLSLRADPGTSGTQSTWDDRAAMAHVEAAVAAGADIIDIGGVPARPGSVVDPAEEIRRTVPMVAAVRRSYPDLVISVDTWRHEVARAACAAGADLINDSWGGWDSQLAEVAAEHDVALLCAHTGGQEPRTRPFRVAYRDVLADVLEQTLSLASRAVAAGVDPSRILIDLAHDFGKNTWHSLEVNRRLADMTATGWPVLVSLSRKDFVGETLGLPPAERLTGTLATTAVCAWLGARVFRVHDVPQTRQLLRMVSAIRGDLPPERAVRGMG